MDIDLLKSFIAICETGSFTAAARQVGRTQSAVSLQIRRLETILGRPLLSRASGNVQLTDHGELFLGYAKDIVSSYGAALAAFNRGSVEGVVVLGLSEHYAPRILSDVLHSFIELYPLATVDLVLEESMVLAKGLGEGAIDLAFITEGIGPVRGGPIVFRDEIVWVAPLAGNIHEQGSLAGRHSRRGRQLCAGHDGGAREDEARAPCRGDQPQHHRAARRGGGRTGGLGHGPQRRHRRHARAHAQEGFPPLGKFNIRLERSHLKKSPIIDRLEAHLIARLSHEHTP